MRRLLLVAGRASHPSGEHEFRAGVLLLQRCLAGVDDLVVEVYDQGWPDEDDAVDHADAVVVFADGGAGHPILEHDRMERLQARAATGAGLGLMHYAVELPADHGAEEVRSWIGGTYEDAFSCNPMWEAAFDTFPAHPITNGVEPFSAFDEWYFNLRFADGFSADGPVERDGTRFVPILLVIPSDEVRAGPYVWPEGPYPHVIAASGRREVLAWAVERPDGGRGFGFTGGHFQRNWGIEPFRRLVLNALVWVSGLDVPPEGVDSTLEPGELERNLFEHS